MLERLEQLGEIPVLDRSNTLLGPDLNNNGIRDDIDKLIASWNVTAPQSAALQQGAKALQLVLKDDWKPPVSPERAATANKIMNQMSRATSCEFDVFEGQYPAMNEYTRKLEAATFNTRDRTKAYIALSMVLSGGVFSSQRPNVCDQ